MVCRAGGVGGRRIGAKRYGGNWGRVQGTSMRIEKKMVCLELKILLRYLSN